MKKMSDMVGLVPGFMVCGLDHIATDPYKGKIITKVINNFDTIKSKS